MDEEELIQEFKNVLNDLAPGCDNMLELKSKYNYCMYNAGPNKDKHILGAKKLYEKS